jgi:predicted amidophosphoribosyltransferase
MSSGKIRHEKNCLNCGNNIEHLFCSKCGQKNVEIKENFCKAIYEWFEKNKQELENFKKREGAKEEQSQSFKKAVGLGG